MKSSSFHKAPSLPLVFAGFSSVSSLLCGLDSVMALTGVVATLLLLTFTGVSSLSSVFRGLDCVTILRAVAAPLAGGLVDKEVRGEGWILAGCA